MKKISVPSEVAVRLFPAVILMFELLIIKIFHKAKDMGQDLGI